VASIATFPSALDADVILPAQDLGKRSVQVIGVALDDPQADGERLSFVVVDHDGRGRLVPASQLTFTDDAVSPPKYG
jgi:hypothetical protein